MKNVLFVSYYYPPAGAVASLRAARFVRHLPEFGWQPLVLTVASDVFPVNDQSLGETIPAATPVWRNRLLRPGALLRGWARRGRRAESGRATVERGVSLRHSGFARILGRLSSKVFIPDSQVVWLPALVATGVKISHRCPVDALYTTGGPFSVHLGGVLLNRILSRPWLADFRDAWLTATEPQPTGCHRLLAGAFERRVVERADRVVVVSPPMADDFKERYPAAARKVAIVPNGYDSNGNDGPDIRKPESLPAVFTITYTGSISPARRQSLRLFTAALRGALRLRPGIGQDLRVRFLGSFNPEDRLVIGDLVGQRVVEEAGYLSHAECVRQQAQSHVLLLMVEPGPGNEGIVTGKIFEYLASGRPILAFAPAGAAADLVRATGAGVVVGPAAVETEGAAAILDLYDRHRAGRLGAHPRSSVLERYESRRLTGELAALLDEIAVARAPTHGREAG